MWIDTHAHLDAAEFDRDRDAVVARSVAAGVLAWVIPAVEVANFDVVRKLAHRYGCAYALGIHPLAVQKAAQDDLEALKNALQAHRNDPRLVAVGEIGLDHFVPGLDRPLQRQFYLQQLRLARAMDLPVILHVRRSADALLQGLRQLPVAGGIAHAFNGSAVQADQFVQRGFKLGLGGTLSFERALRIRALARELPESALVLETDSPDIPPQWLYRSAAQRQGSADALPLPQGRNEPAELPRIGQVLADLRGWSLAQTAQICSHNSHVALPRLRAALAPAAPTAA